MRLGRVPRAAAGTAQPLGQHEQPRELARDRDVAGVDEHRREVVGLDRLVELGERARAPCARRASPRPWSTITSCSGRQHLEERELHVGEHEPGVALREQHRARESGGVDGERARRRSPARRSSGRCPDVFHAMSANEMPGHDLDVDPDPAQQGHRALGDRRAARHRVRDLAVLVRGLDDPRRDRRVDGVEVVAAVVEEVERFEVRDPRAPDPSTAGWRAVRTYRTGMRSNAARAAGRSRSTPAGPSPTTTTRGRLTRPRERSWSWSCWSPVRTRPTSRDTSARPEQRAAARRATCSRSGRSGGPTCRSAD